MKREIAAFGFFLLVAVVFTWPLAVQLDTAVPDRGDPILNAWIIDWVCHSLTSAPLRMFDAPIYHPGKYALAYSENLIGVALLVWPLHVAGVSAVAVYNVAVLLGFAFAAYGAWVLARYVTGSTAGALVAGIFFAFTSYKISRIQHIQVIWSGWLPILLAALLAYWRTPTVKRAALLGAAFLMNGLTVIYWLVFGGFTMLCTIGLLAVAQPRHDRAFWLRLGAALAIASVLLLPVLIPYQLMANEYGARRTSQEARLGSATLFDWGAPHGRNLLYGSIADLSEHRDEHELFPGLLVVFLTIYAFATRPRTAAAFGSDAPRKRWLLDVLIVLFATLTYCIAVAGRVTIGRVSFSGPDVAAVITIALLIVRNRERLRDAVRTSRFSADELSAALWLAVGFIASFGWNLFLHPFLFRVLPPFRATRAPVRWAVIVGVGLAVWAAIGIRDFLARRESVTARRAFAALFLALAIVETVPAIEWRHVDRDPAPVYRWLASARPGVVLELPMVAEDVPFLYLLASTTHRVPLMNGTSGFEPPIAEMLRKKELALQYDDEFFAAMRAHGGTTLIVHDALLTPEQRAALEPARQRFRVTQQFGSDVVYDVR